MSKVINEQVKKAEALISGLRKHPEMMKKAGLNEALINTLETESKLLNSQNQELEDLELKRREASRKANKKYNEIRVHFQDMKKKIKLSFDPSEWAQAGISDKK
ncbi:MAG: hypothetical protein LBR48_04365 [Dysgonamonadaceae bacterium]|jgi:ACT domain-containing protein|nr:hypothetical protein [Dysgonamonadaceae bacterium]